MEGNLHGNQIICGIFTKTSMQTLLLKPKKCNRTVQKRMPTPLLAQTHIPTADIVEKKLNESTSSADISSDEEDNFKFESG